MTSKGVSQIFKILFQTAYRKSETRDPGHRTRNPYVGSRTGALHLGPFTWDPEPGPWDPRPYMRDPLWNRDQILLRGTRDPYINKNLGTPTLTTFS